MDTAEQLLRNRDLSEALQALQQQVRAEPQEARHRVFLCQLLCVLGQWERALTQMNVAAKLDAANLMLAGVYREAVQCEILRARIFAGHRTPLVFGEPPAWLAPMIQAVQVSARGEHGAAADLRGEALDQADAVSGQIDGQPFEWLCDADSRLGPVFEAIIDGRYFWVPMGSVHTVEVEGPTDLRDMVWAPARFRWPNGGDSVALIPSRYPGTESSEDPVLRLAHASQWEEVDEVSFQGVGQRNWMSESAYHPMLNVRQIVFEVELTASAEAPAMRGETEGG